MLLTYMPLGILTCPCTYTDATRYYMLSMIISIICAGVQYEQCKWGLLIFALHVANLILMFLMFRWYINKKTYYHPIRMFQVVLLIPCCSKKLYLSKNKLKLFIILQHYTTYNAVRQPQTKLKGI